MSEVVQVVTWRVSLDIELYLIKATPLPLVYADSLLIATVLLTLLRSVINAAGRNGRVNIETLFSAAEVLVGLTGTGRCMPLDTRGGVLDLDRTTHRGRKPGLELLAAQAIIARHSGSIIVQSIEQNSARVEVSFPKQGGV
jgi:K+-sensing histidine kinase KdpD